MAETTEKYTPAQAEIAKALATQVSDAARALLNLGMTQNDVAQLICNKLTSITAALALNGYGNDEQAINYLRHLTAFHMVEAEHRAAAERELREKGGKLDG